MSCGSYGSLFSPAFATKKGKHWKLETHHDPVTGWSNLSTITITISPQVGRLAGADHVLMTEMQRRVAELTGIPVHADEPMTKSGGLEGKVCRKLWDLRLKHIEAFLKCFLKLFLRSKLFFSNYVLPHLIFPGWKGWLDTRIMEHCCRKPWSLEGLFLNGQIWGFLSQFGRWFWSTCFPISTPK